MKRMMMVMMTMMLMAVSASAQKIEFEKTSHDFGNFKKANPVLRYTFKFKNTGDKPLIVHRAVASCGCTAANYTKKPVQPGETGVIEVEYNGSRFLPGHFKKSITVNTNGTPEMVRIYIEGNMEE